jgi:hypothetical protein
MARKSQRGSGGCGYNPKIRRSQKAGGSRRRSVRRSRSQKAGGRGCGHTPRPVRRSQKAGGKGHYHNNKPGRRRGTRKGRRTLNKKRKSFVLLCDPSSNTCKGA